MDMIREHKEGETDRQEPYGLDFAIRVENQSHNCRCAEQDRESETKSKDNLLRQVKLPFEDNIGDTPEVGHLELV